MVGRVAATTGDPGLFHQVNEIVSSSQTIGGNAYLYPYSTETTTDAAGNIYVHVPINGIATIDIYHNSCKGVRKLLKTKTFDTVGQQLLIVSYYPSGKVRFIIALSATDLQSHPALLPIGKGFAIAGVASTDVSLNGVSATSTGVSNLYFAKVSTGLSTNSQCAKICKNI